MTCHIRIRCLWSGIWRFGWPSLQCSCSDRAVELTGRSSWCCGWWPWSHRSTRCLVHLSWAWYLLFWDDLLAANRRKSSRLPCDSSWLQPRLCCCWAPPSPWCIGCRDLISWGNGRFDPCKFFGGQHCCRCYKSCRWWSRIPWLGAVLIKILEKYFSKIKFWSMKTVDMSMLSNSHLVNFWKKYS